MLTTIKTYFDTLINVVPNHEAGQMSFGTITLETTPPPDFLITIKAETIPEKLPEVPKG